jgi:phospholipase/carboxylesterase
VKRVFSSLARLRARFNLALGVVTVTLLLAVPLAMRSQAEAPRAPDAGSRAARATAAKPPLPFVELVLGADKDAELPLLLVLHGLGDRPEHFVQLFNVLDTPVRIVAPRAPDPFSSGSSWFPIDDPKRAPEGILERARLLVRFLAHVQKTRPTRGLPVVTGFSQGGILSFALAAYHPEQIAAALPIAGSLLDTLPPYQKAPPGFFVTAFHGRKDGRIPYAGAERTVARLQAIGTSASLTGFDKVGHEVPPAMQRALAAALQAELQRVER